MNVSFLTWVVPVVGYSGYIFGAVIYFITIKKMAAYQGVDKTLELNQQTIDFYKESVAALTKKVDDLKKQVEDLSEQNTKQAGQITDLQNTINGMSDTTGIMNYLKDQVSKSAGVTKEYGDKIDLILTLLKDGKNIVNVNTK